MSGEHTVHYWWMRMTVHFLNSEQSSKDKFKNQKPEMREMQILVVKHGRKGELGQIKYIINFLPKYCGIVPVHYKGIYWVPKTIY